VCSRRGLAGSAVLAHNNNTGRWLTNFKAYFDPKADTCFYTGAMTRPRSIDVFDASSPRL
jgi:hypothetical protein